MCFIVNVKDSFILVDKVENYRLCCRSILGPKAFLAPRFRDDRVQLAGTISLCTLTFKLYNPVGKN